MTLLNTNFIFPSLQHYTPHVVSRSIVSSSWWWAYKCPKHVEQVTSSINHWVATSWFSSPRRCTDKHTSNLQKAYLTYYVHLVGIKNKWLAGSKVSVCIPLSYFPKTNIHCWWSAYWEKSWFSRLHKWLNWGTLCGNRSCVIEMVTTT
jgi:hypothetical protein